MPDGAVTRNVTTGGGKGPGLRSDEAFAILDVISVYKFLRGNLLASLQFDAGNLEKSFLAAGDQELGVLQGDGAGEWRGL